MTGRIHRELSLLCAAAFASIVLWPGSAPGAGAQPDRLELLNLLRQGDFAALESRFRHYEAAYRDGQATDMVLENAFYAFASADPALEARLDRWVAERPESGTALVARASYFKHLGWVSRGARTAGRTADARFSAMRDYFALAGADLEAALRINPRTSVAYGFQINMAMARGDYEGADTALRRGLQADPRSFAIRRRYLYSLQPWWRGSSNWSGLLDAALREVRDAADELPALRPLLGYGDFVKAEQLRRRRQREAAIDYYERALSFGDYWWYYHRQGKNFYLLKRYDRALESFDRALAARPQHTAILDWRARIHQKMGNFDKAFADWDRALALDPWNPAILVHKAYALRARDRYSEALAALDKAMHYGADEENVRDARGRLHLYELEDPAGGLADLRRATELDPRSKKYWYNYALALYRLKDCQAKDALVRYRKACDDGAKCSKKSLKWAGEAIDYLSHPQVCPT